MAKRTNYYRDLAADFSLTGLVPEERGRQLLDRSAGFLKLREPAMPAMGHAYDKAQAEKENREWFPTHCQALRSGRFDLLSREYHDEYVYLCQDGPFYGKENDREKHWVAIIAQPGVTMCWPVVQFTGEVVYFEWHALDNETHEIIAKGNVTFLRRGHRGGVYVKTEHLTFFRDVHASEELLRLLRK